MTDYKMCGKIMATHGIRGALKVANYSDFNRFEAGKFVFIKEYNLYRRFKIKQVSDYKTGFLVTFENYEDINLVEKFIGENLYVLTSKDDLEEDEFYYSDLIGKDIYNQNNELRAKVKKVLEYPQSHMLECVTLDNKIKYIPFIDQFVKEVLEDKIIIEEIEGLL